MPISQQFGGISGKEEVHAGVDPERRERPRVWKRIVTKTKFRMGERVLFTSGTVGRPGAGDGYTIVRVLPLEKGEQQYRIKSASEQHERVATESQLDRRT